MVNKTSATLLFVNEMEKDEQRKAIFDFQCKRKRILVTTDGMTRGLDFPGLEVIINIGLPNLLEDYSQRISLGGRFGNNNKQLQINY